MAVELILAGAAAGAAALAVAGRAAAREAAAEAAHPPCGEILTLSGRRIHALTRGAGPDLVLIHGANGNLRDFFPGLGPALATRFRVTAFDRPGLGYSDRVAADLAHPLARRAESPGEQAALLHRAAAALGLRRPLLLGHSYGAAVALAWALDHGDDVAGVLALSGATMPWPGSLDPLYRIGGTALGGALLAPLGAALTPRSYMARVIAAIFSPDPVPPGYAWQVGAGLALRRATLRANLRQINNLRPHVVAMAARYRHLSLPVEILHGTADRIVPAAIHAGPLSALLPDGALTLLRGTGHMPHHAAPAAVIAAIDRLAARAGLR